MSPLVRSSAAATALVCVFLATRPARADLRWDLGATLGADKRFAGGRTGSVPDIGFGPRAEIRAHLSLLPLVRVGAYIAEEVSPQGDSWRQASTVGLRVKVTSPFPERPLRLYGFFGAGFTGVYRPSTSAIEGRGGRHMEIPLGLGAGYTFRKPWTLTLEVGANLGAFFGGSLYDSSRPIFEGKDVASIGASLGIQLDL